MNDTDKKALEDWKVSTPEIKYKFENGSLLQEMIAGEAWQAACEWRDSQVGEPVAWTCDDDFTFNLRVAQKWERDGLVVKAFYSAPPTALINQQMVEALDFVVNRFGPERDDLIFSKRMAIDKAKNALAAATQMRGGA